MKKLAALPIVLLALTMIGPETVHAQVGTTNAFPNLTFARITDIQAPPDGTNRLFAAEQAGIIRVFANDPSTSAADVFLDISSQVTGPTICNECGLLGLAFHPDYANNGFFFVSYTTGDLSTPADPLRNVTSRFSVSASDPDAADPNSELIMLELEQPAGNHNGGQLQFGPGDGYLYFGVGDGGGSGDPNENGENPTTLLGSILRIDVDGAGGTKRGSSSVVPDCGAGPNTNYTIPASNPLVDGPGNNCDEIWAYGLRNPWRFSFGSGHLWVADVGQNAWEEISWVEPGLNYGWDMMEGSSCFEPSTSCVQTGLTLPIWEYDHNAGHSITGGYVYNGFECSELSGKYIYGDYISTNIWTIEFDENGVTINTLLIDDSGLRISTFGVDQQGELYIGHLRSSGAIHKFTGCTPLPVELVSFEAVADGRDVLLSWATASETNNAGFEVQSKFAGENLENGEDEWFVLGWVEGAGTTELPQRYEFRVEGLVPGRHIFRLKQIDFDGTFEYSPQVEVVIVPTSAYYLSDAHPNPFTSSTRVALTLAHAQHVRVEVYDVLGRRVAVLHDGLLAANVAHTFSFEAGMVPSGLYLYRVTGATFTASKPILRLK